MLSWGPQDTPPSQLITYCLFVCFTLRLFSLNALLQFFPVLLCLKIQSDNKSISLEQVLIGIKCNISIGYRMFVFPQDFNECVY